MQTIELTKLLAQGKFGYLHVPKDTQVEGPQLLSAGKHLTAAKLNEGTVLTTTGLGVVGWFVVV